MPDPENNTDDEDTFSGERDDLEEDEGEEEDEDQEGEELEPEEDPES